MAAYVLVSGTSESEHVRPRRVICQFAMLFFKKFFLKLFGSSGLRCSHAGRLSLVVVGMGHSFVAERGLLGHSGFSSHGTQAHLPRDVWDSPGRGTEPTSPAPAGRGFLTSGPLGMSLMFLKGLH